MAFKPGEQVRIKDIRNKSDWPERMRAYSGQITHVIRVISYQDCDKSYYELETDVGYGLWPEEFLEPYQTPKSEQAEQEWIDTVLKLIAEIEGKLDQLKRQLWRKKHYGNR